MGYNMNSREIKKAKRLRTLGNPTESQIEAADKTHKAIKEKKIKLNKRQYNFIDNWLVPTSPTFANAYAAAIEAGFSKSYARIITGNALGLEWVQEAKKNLVGYEPEHIYRAFQGVASDPKAQHRDKLKALELMGKARGMFIDRVQSDVQVRFVNDVPRPDTEREVIDLETP